MFGMGSGRLGVSQTWCRALRRHPSKRPRRSFSDSSAGEVQSVWIFCRHGDRAPSRPLTPLHYRSQEAAYWTSKLPHAYETFSQRFPPIIDADGGKFIDTSRHPFGFLTEEGIQQLQNKGKTLLERYKDSNDFLQDWNVQAYSTNYLRTVLSAQSLLDGLLETNLYDATAEENMYKENTDRIIPDHDTRGPDFGADTLVPVHIRSLDDDPLRANPDTMARLVSHVTTTPSFRQYDGQVASVAARLAHILPGLVRYPRPPVPSGINWVEAADHFVCRQAHDLELAQFTDGDEEVLQALSHPTLHHLAWRFRQWYQHPPLLSILTAPALEQVLNPPSTRTMTIYSCHDITILGLLYALKADFLETEWPYFWPAYASDLVLELVRLPTGQEVIRVFLNGEPVGKDQTMDEFERLVKELASHSDAMQV